MQSKIKEFFKRNREEIILAILIFLISLFSFALGFILAKIQEKEKLEMEIYENSNSRGWNFWPLFGLEAFGKGKRSNRF